MVRMVRALGCAIAAASLGVPAGAATTLDGSGGHTSAGAFAGAKLRGFLSAPSNQQQSQEQTDAPVSGTGNRIRQQVGWSGPNSFTLTYDAASDVLSAVVNNGPAIVHSNALAGLAGDPFGRVSIGVRDPSIAGFVFLSDLMLDGEKADIALNGFSGEGYRFWEIAGADLDQGFTLSGTLALNQQFAASSTGPSSLEFIIGANAIPEPAAWALMIGGFGLTGAVLRQRRRRAAVAA